MPILISAIMVALGTIIACKADFNYIWYGLDVEQQKLLGPSPSFDEPLSICREDGDEKGKCVVFKQREFERLMGDFLETEERLKQCERPH